MHLSRRDFLSTAAGTLSAASSYAQQRRLFDSHCHIIDHRFPIVANQGYIPPNFPLEAYLAQAKPLGVVAGAVVSGSFQANDQTYLMDILPRLGAGWVGVTQIPERLSRRRDRQARCTRRARGTLQRVPRPNRQRR